MELLLSVLLFVLLAGLTTVTGVKLWARPRAAMERITGTVAQTETHMPVHPSLVFRDLVVRLGSMLPAQISKSGLTQRRLIRAGYRSPHAIRMLYGARLLLAVALPAGAILLSTALDIASDMKVMAVAAAAMAGYAAPGCFVALKARRRQRRIRRGLPDALDLLVICVESGLGLDQALMQVAKELELAHPDISLEFTMVNVELRTGKRRAEALRGLAERTAVDDLKKLVAVLIQADRFGTGVAQSLRMHADYMRVQARQKAEEMAAKVGVKLVFPIFFCILPTLFVVTVGPMAVRISRELLPMMNGL
jgi:tight adherence protein C